ncbi:J domain-containing protein [Massilia sp. PAMC28688]|uniref:J domain-containing protein n=1 Tax=Massilia sp. PAMC28688 TaxID=2861283 RepID=UPI001C62BFE4|nr:J domain-containing protein [Massilia sp. PAMC28688]QYF94946.1 J domain-containing protein [Massilia sp. PAMC28688]
MARIHTHYDNLKVSRGAPQEVVRAAYKALSQKYHPDKNPGDAKAARIMAILNSAYASLSDPVRRREHDEWIAAEEWEIAWLESTQADDGREAAEPEWEPEAVPQPAPYRALRDPHWWLGMTAALAAGVVAGLLLMSHTRAVPAAVASALGGAAAAPQAASPRRTDPLPDGWAVDQPPGEEAVPPQVKVVALSQVVIPARAPDCDQALRGLAAPGGLDWPEASGYLDGFPLDNVGSGVQVVIDNAANPSPVLVKVIDSARGAAVRHLFLQPGASMTVDNLAAGRYEVRYQNLQVGGSAEACIARPRPALGGNGPAA